MFPNRKYANVWAIATLLALSYLIAADVWLNSLYGMLPAPAGGPATLPSNSLQATDAWLGGLGALLAALLACAGLRRRRRAPNSNGEATAVARYSIRTLLTLLSLATALPLVLVLGYQAQETNRAEIAQANELVAHLANVTAIDVEATLLNFERVATILAQRTLVRELNPARCDPRLEEMRRTYPPLANVGTVDTHGQAICSAVAPPDGRLPNIGNPPWLATLRRTNKFVVGTPQRGIYTGRAILVLAYPIRDDQNNVAGAAQLILNLDQFLLLVTKTLPEGGVAGILNSEGTIVARSFRPEEAVGKNVRGIGINNAILERKHGTEVATGADGVERFYAFQPVGQSGWFGVVGIPTERIYADARRNVWRNGLLSLAALALSFLLVFVVHRKIVSPILDLRSAALRVTGGDLAQRAPVTGPREVADVAAGFNQMLDQLLVTSNRLDASEAQYRTLFDASPDAIRVICDDRIVLMNPAGFALHGVTQDQLNRSKSVFDYVHPEFTARARERRRQLIEERRALPREDRKIIRADGSAVDVEMISLPVTYLGKPAALDIMHDLTERKAHEAAVHQLNAELELRVQKRTEELTRANADLELFSSTIAHDLRSPLRSIIGYAQLVREGHSSALGQEGVLFLERIVGSANRMNQLIEGLLKLAHLSRVEPVMSQVNLSQVAQSIVDAMRVGERERNVEVRIQEDMIADADFQLILDALENLIGNAWKYTSRTDPALIEFGTTGIGSVTTYFVRDNGAGFDATYADKLFKMFQRLHGAAEFPGTGIGLATVKRIIDHHGGKIWAEGAIGRGATFYFTLGKEPSIAA